MGLCYSLFGYDRLIEQEKEKETKYRISDIVDLGKNEKLGIQ